MFKKVAFSINSKQFLQSIAAKGKGHVGVTGNHICRTCASYHQPLDVKTHLSNPLEHSDAQDALFYSVPAEYQRFFRTGQRSQYIRACRGLGEAGVMVRRPALEIFKCLQNTDFSLPAVRYGIYGADGCGKSMTLGHVMHRCAQDGWFILHHPYIPLLTRAKWGATESLMEPGRFDQPQLARQWLKYLLELNHALLHENKLVTRNTYTWTRKEKTEEGSSWTKLILYAQEQDKFACDAVFVLLKEIREAAANGDVRVLVAFDGANALYNTESRVRNPADHNQCLDNDKLSLTLALRKMMHNWNNGAILCTIDGTACEPYTPAQTPREILGAQGFVAFDPFIPVHVPQYSQKEAHSLIEYLAERKFINNQRALTEEGRKKLFFMSANNPKHLYNCTLRL